jgi:hypothetical protein
LLSAYLLSRLGEVHGYIGHPESRGRHADVDLRNIEIPGTRLSVAILKRSIHVIALRLIHSGQIFFH